MGRSNMLKILMLAVLLAGFLMLSSPAAHAKCDSTGKNCDSAGVHVRADGDKIDLFGKYVLSTSGLRPAPPSKKTPVAGNSPVFTGGVRSSNVVAAWGSVNLFDRALNCQIGGSHSDDVWALFCGPKPVNDQVPSSKQDDVVASSDETFSEMIRQELASVKLSGAGLQVQPEKLSLIGIPTLAHARHPSQTVTVNVLDMDVPVKLTGVRFTFDWGDGTPPVSYDHAGLPWPDKSIQHMYTQPNPSGVVKLDVDWVGTAVDPFSGDMISVDGAAHTSEVSTAFVIRRAHTELTSLGEELEGH